MNIQIIGAYFIHVNNKTLCETNNQMGPIPVILYKLCRVCDDGLLASLSKNPTKEIKTTKILRDVKRLGFVGVRVFCWVLRKTCQ